MVALAERLRLESDSSDRKNLVGSQIIPARVTGEVVASTHMMDGFASIGFVRPDQNK